MTHVALLTLFASLTASNDLPKGLLSAVCWVESNHRVNAIHRDDGGENSLGVCEIKLGTAAMLGFKGTEKMLMNPNTNAEYAAKYLKHLMFRYHNDVNKTISAYNAGTFTHKNRVYVDKVLKAWHTNK